MAVMGRRSLLRRPCCSSMSRRTIWTWMPRSGARQPPPTTRTCTLSLRIVARVENATSAPRLGPPHATSAPGLGSPHATSAPGLAPCHICTGTAPLGCDATQRHPAFAHASWRCTCHSLVAVCLQTRRLWRFCRMSFFDSAPQTPQRTTQQRTHSTHHSSTSSLAFFLPCDSHICTGTRRVQPRRVAATFLPG